MTENKLSKQLYTIQQVTELLSIGRTSTYQAIKEGKLAAKKYGARTLVTAESLQNFINNLPNLQNNGGKND